MRHYRKLDSKNMKEVLIIILISIISTGLYSQIFYSDTLTTIAYWQKGESYKYQLDKYRLKQKGANITETNSTSYITLYIEEETDSNYLIRYTIDSLKVIGLFEDSPLMNAFTSQISNKLTYLIETDENGTLKEIKNWKELKTNIIELLSEMELFNSMNQEERKRAKYAIETMTDSKEKIQSMFTREFAILFANYGYVFDTRDTIVYEQQLPNPYGGPPFPQEGVIYFDNSKVDSTNSVILHDKSSIDEEEGKKAIIQVLKQITPDFKEIESEMENVEFKVEDSMTQEFDTNSGAITNAIMERKVVSNDLKEKNIRIDRQSWKLLRVE